MYKYRVSESYRAWLRDLRIQIKEPRLPGATGLNPVNQPLLLSEADKPGSPKPALCLGWRRDLSVTLCNHGLTIPWEQCRIFGLPHSVVQLAICHSSGTGINVQGSQQPPGPSWIFGILKCLHFFYWHGCIERNYRKEK